MRRWSPRIHAIRTQEPGPGTEVVRLSDPHQVGSPGDGHWGTINGHDLPNVQVRDAKNVQMEKNLLPPLVKYEFSVVKYEFVVSAPSGLLSDP